MIMTCQNTVTTCFTIKLLKSKNKAAILQLTVLTTAAAAGGHWLQTAFLFFSRYASMSVLSGK